MRAPTYPYGGGAGPFGGKTQIFKRSYSSSAKPSSSLVKSNTLNKVTSEKSPMDP